VLLCQAQWLEIVSIDAQHVGSGPKTTLQFIQRTNVANAAQDSSEVPPPMSHPCGMIARVAAAAA